MKWVKLIISVAVGVVAFWFGFALLMMQFDFSENYGMMMNPYATSLEDSITFYDNVPQVPFFKELLYGVLIALLVFIVTTITVKITEIYKVLAAIVVGIIAGFIATAFHGFVSIHFGLLVKTTILWSGVIGWLASKYSGAIIEKIKAGSKALTSEFDD